MGIGIALIVLFSAIVGPVVNQYEPSSEKSVVTPCVHRNNKIDPMHDTPYEMPDTCH